MALTTAAPLPAPAAAACPVTPLPLPPSDHHITLADAAAETAAYRARPTVMPHTLAFSRGGMDRILAQPGCTGVRFYPALKDERPTIVAVGVDGRGHDMLDGWLSNEPWICPPYCPQGNLLNDGEATGIGDTLPAGRLDAACPVAPQGLPDYDHHITLEYAADLTAAFRASPTAFPNSLAFSRAALDNILVQGGCEGVRLYAAVHHGKPALVLVGVDARGHDIVDGWLSNDPWECPPFCPDGNVLNGLGG